MIPTFQHLYRPFSPWTLHIEGHLHTGAHHLTHKIAADHTLDQATNQLRKPCIRYFVTFQKIPR